MTIEVHGKRLDLTVPKVMGILNITPDSFFAGSRKQTEHEIAKRTEEIMLQGGAIIDLGAFSTRPGAAEVSQEEEMKRMRNALAIVRDICPDTMLSIDTFRPEVARMSVEEFGADIINDVSEGGITGIVDTPLEDEYAKNAKGVPAIFQEVARLKVPYILMSVQPTLELTMEHFRQHIDTLHSIGHDQIILDPGYGFGKDVINGNFSLLASQKTIKDTFKLPLLVGVSRKRMIWQLLDESADTALNGTTAVNMLALERGADILRVHDVKEAVEAVKIYNQLKSASVSMCESII